MGSRPLFRRGPAEVPIAHVNPVNDQPRFEDDRVRDHRVVERVRVFGDVEVFLDLPARVGEERPVGADAAAVFVRLGELFRTYLILSSEAFARY